jgi:membrane associated rhomboid family serine protease
VLHGRLAREAAPFRRLETRPASEHLTADDRGNLSLRRQRPYDGLVIPVGDFLRRRTTPYVNWILIAINIAVFIYSLTLSTQPDRVIADFRTSEADRFLLDWGFVSACLAEQFGVDSGVNAARLAEICPSGDRELIQPFTAMFLHAGWAHIAGNMLFLWIFGDNVEDRLGHVRYLIFYFLCGLGAAALQTALATDNTLPAVGASGAIAGVLGGYLMMFPTAVVQVVILPLFFIPFFLPAIVLIGIWFVTQVFSGIGELGRATAGSGVAWWAHVGGFVTGALLIWPFKKRGRARRAYQRFVPDT